MRKSVVAILAAIALAVSALAMSGCGVCGAHIHDWWYIHKDASDESPLVSVCRFCYQDALAEDATNN